MLRVNNATGFSTLTVVDISKYITLLTRLTTDYNDSSGNNITMTRQANGSGTQPTLSYAGRQALFLSNASLYYNELPQMYYQGSNYTLTNSVNNDFCAELYFYPAASVYQTRNRILFGVTGLNLSNDSQWFVYFQESTNSLYASMCVGNTVYGTASGTIQRSTWSHIALTRNNGVFKFFINGQTIGTSNMTGLSLNANGIFRVGGINSSSDYMAVSGYVGYIRYTKGHPRYITDFTPVLY